MGVIHINVFHMLIYYNYFDVLRWRIHTDNRKPIQNRSHKIKMASDVVCLCNEDDDNAFSLA